MIKQNTAVKGSSIKFPQIRSRNLDSPSLNNSRQQAKLRPASLNKVQDLEKKLFNKLDVYQQIAVKKKGKRIASIRDASFDNLIENPFDLQPSSQITDKQFDPNLQKLKKLMPQLYGKLMQAKDGGATSIPQPSQSAKIGTGTAISSSKNIGKEQLAVSTKQKQQSNSTVKGKYKSIGAVQTQTTVNLKRNNHPFLTQLRNSSSNHLQNGFKTQKKQKIQQFNKSVNKQQFVQTDFDRIQRITNKQMQQIYKQYQIQEGLDKEAYNYHYHSNDELKNMGKDLIDCQSEINSLEKSMSSLIKQIGNIYASDMMNIGIQRDEPDKEA